MEVNCVFSIEVDGERVKMLFPFIFIATYNCLPNL